MTARYGKLIAVLGALIEVSLAAATLRAQAIITVDPAAPRQSFHGFGVGSIFYQGHLASGVPPEFRTSTYDLLFRDVPHRYHLFWFRPNETTNDNADPYVVNWSGFTFGSAQEEYVTVLRESLARNSNVVAMATVYTPPAWMKTNRSETDGGTLDPGVPNVHAEFAEFVFANLHWFWQRGVRVAVVTLMNEPDYTLSHEDADFTAAQTRDVHRYTVPALQSLIDGAQNTAGVRMPQIMGPSTLSVATAGSYVDTLRADATAWTNTHLISTHQYGGASEANFAALVTKAAGKPVIMSEWHSANNNDIDPEDVEVVEQGRAIAQAVNGGVNGYLWFEANHPGNGFAGLIHLPWWDTDGPNVMKTYHSWKQWARLTPWDARCLGVTTLSRPASIEGVVAFQAPGASNLIVHVVKSGSVPDSLVLGVAGHFLTRVEQFATSASQAFVPVQDRSLPAGTQEITVSLEGNQLASFRLTLARFEWPLIARGSTWRYFDRTNDLGVAWRSNAFSDLAWSSGQAQLGFGDGDEASLIASNRQITTYFRRSFWASPLSFTNMNLRLLRDDGGVVFLNGVEVFRSNLGNGPVNFLTLASNALPADETSRFYGTHVDPALLVDGENLLAVEIHQSSEGSSDLSFDLELTGLATPSGALVEVTNEGGADEVGYTSARLNGRLTILNAEPAEVTVYWGLSDGATNVAAWEKTTSVTAVGYGHFAVTVSNLVASTNYFYRCRASNALGQAWASSSASFATRFAPPVTLIAAGAVWRYFDQTNDLGTAWRSNGFSDASWGSGRARLGYGGDGEVTTISSNLQRTTYFRRSFYVPVPALVVGLSGRLTRDDGAVIYLNGAEVWRDNLPAGVIGYQTFASTGINAPQETNWIAKNLDSAGLVSGWNLLAAEIHQQIFSQSDLGFDFELRGAALLTNRPLLELRATAAGFDLMWPLEASHFVLCSTTNLTWPMWVRVANEPVLSNSVWTLTLPTETDRQQFFQLQAR